MCATLPSIAAAWDASTVLGAAVSGHHRPAVTIPGTDVLERPRRASTPPQLALATNHFVNAQVALASDLSVWGVVDYWASPLEKLNRGIGDCEDFAIAKYFILAALGWPEDSLRMVYAWNDPGEVGLRERPHIVLAVSNASDDDPWPLDNIVAYSCIGLVSSAQRANSPSTDSLTTIPRDRVMLAGSEASDPLEGRRDWACHELQLVKRYEINGRARGITHARQCSAVVR